MTPYWDLAVDLARAADQEIREGRHLPFNPQPKPEPRCVLKRKAEKVDAKHERECREITRKRDKGRCRIPGCSERATELHHIVARSQSKRKRWLTSNCVWICTDHHRLRHAGIIQISGDADTEIIVTGDVDRLRFRL